MRLAVTARTCALVCFALAAVAAPTDAAADAHCFCSLAWQDNTNYQGSPAKGWLWDSGSLATYTGITQQSDKNQTACNTLCTQRCLAEWNKDKAAALACAKGVPSGSTLMCWSKVGTREWKSAQGIGTLVNTPAQFKTTCKCPEGTYGQPWVNGGTVPQGAKCAFVVCDHYQPFPGTGYPANGTAIGTWGFTWGAFFGQNIDPTCTTTQTAPAVCTIR